VAQALTVPVVSRSGQQEAIMKAMASKAAARCMKSLSG